LFLFKYSPRSIIADLSVKDELKQELEELEQAELNERLNQADHVPVHQPPSAKKVEESKSLDRSTGVICSDT